MGKPEILKLQNTKEVVPLKLFYILFCGAILLIVAAASVYLGIQIGKKQANSSFVPQSPETFPALVLDETTNWQTYTQENFLFKFPASWIEKSKVIGGSHFAQEFEDPEGKYNFSLVVRGNYNQMTGKPHVSLDEVINMPYQVKEVFVAGQVGRQPLPRAGSENVNSVYFFSKDLKTIYNATLKTDDSSLNTPEAEIVEGQKLFSKILETFKFITSNETAD